MRTGSAYGTRTRAPALRGPCPNRLDERAKRSPNVSRGPANSSGSDKRGFHRHTELAAEMQRPNYLDCEKSRNCWCFNSRFLTKTSSGGPDGHRDDRRAANDIYDPIREPANRWRFRLQSRQLGQNHLAAKFLMLGSGLPNTNSWDLA